MRSARWIDVLWACRRQVTLWSAFSIFTILAIQLSAQATDAGMAGSWLDRYLTWPNVLATSAVIFHFGSLRQQLQDVGGRLTRLETWKDTIDAEARRQLAQGH